MVVLGAGRKYLAALITPNEGWIPTSDMTPDMLEAMKRELLSVGSSLNRYEQVQAFALLPRPFAADELTPTQKLRRSVILEKYASLIDRLYQEPTPCLVVLDDNGLK
jgi:long-chain acyl-CoA synthetase